MGSPLMFVVGMLMFIHTIANPMPEIGKTSSILINSGNHKLIVPEEVNEMAGKLLETALHMEVSSYGKTGNANQYIDSMIVNLKEYIKANGYDPLSLGEHSYCKWLRAEGISSLKRTGDSTFTYVNNRVNIEANLGFHGIKAQCYLEYQLWWLFWLTGTVDAHVTDISMYGKMEVNTAADIKGRLLEFNVNDWGKMKVKWDGDNWIGKIVEFFNNMFPSIVQNQLKSRLPGIVKDAINDLLKDYVFPLHQ